MSAPKQGRKKISVEPESPPLGIIAGSGTLPRDLYFRCQKQGIDCVIVGFKSHTNYIKTDFWGRISKSAQVIDFFKKNKVQDIVFIGGIDRPKLHKLRPDWVTFKFFAKSFFKSFGDSSLLDAARDELSSMGFTLQGIHNYMPELLMDEGLLNANDIQSISFDDVMLGVNEAQKLGEQDIGQGVLVCKGEIIAREDERGTSHMVQAFGVEGAILVKMCKPQQDKNLDLPTIGPETVQYCGEKKMAGIVGQAGATLLAEREKLIEQATQSGLFLYGHKVDGDEPC